MPENKLKNEKSGRLFKSNFLERFTRVHPAVAITYNLTFISSLIYFNYRMSFVQGFWPIVGMFFLGFVSWTLAEYLLHRYFFHMKGTFFKPAKKISHTMHGIHHDYPSDFKRLFMPPLPATIFIAFFFVVFYLIMNVRVFVFLPGFMFGYLCYAFTHFQVHYSKPPKALKWLWTHHLKHHYQTQNKAFGVSSPFWDIVFRTLPGKATVKVVNKKDKIQEAKQEEESN